MPPIKNTRTKGGKAVGRSSPQCKRWSFVVFADSAEPHRTLAEKEDILRQAANDDDAIECLRAGYEICPKTKKPHLQCYVRFSKNCRLKAFQRHLCLGNIHGEICRKPEVANLRYCSKDADVRICYGESEADLAEKRSNERAPRCDWRDLMVAAQRGATEKEICQTFPSLYGRYPQGVSNMRYLWAPRVSHPGPRGIWIHGEPGAGKSLFAHTMFPDAFIKSQNKWWDGYAGQSEVLLDDLDSDKLGHHLKIWSDGYYCTGEVKGGTVPLSHRYFIVTSNRTPELLFPCPGKETPEQQQNRLSLIAAVTRRFEIFEMKRKFIPPAVSTVGPGEWITECEPPMPVDKFRSELEAWNTKIKSMFAANLEADDTSAVISTIDGGVADHVMSSTSPEGINTPPVPEAVYLTTDLDPTCLEELS